MSIETLQTDLVQTINENTGDQQALEQATDEIVEHVFNNCNKADLAIVFAQIKVVCRRRRDE